MKLKAIEEQAVVILGASSGIGREVALRFAKRGARVFVAARSEEELASLVDEIQAGGGQAASATCDVADFAQVEFVANAAVAAFGRVDTWVNVAAVSVYARAEETTPEEYRRVMEVNFLGYVHGALAALPRLREAGGGALIAISSVESMVSMPLHAAYSASKHAVEGFVDALRRELIAEGAPISVTSVKPASINTPFFNKSRSKLGVQPQGLPPFYQPGVVADCVLYAAEHPVRDLIAGGSGKVMILSQILSPRLTDAALSRAGMKGQRTSLPKPEGSPDSMFAPDPKDSRVEGDFSSRAKGFSLVTWLQTHPRARAALLLGTAALVLARRRR